ncbi:hypothetical protein B0T20DRAFT_104026 [Sordaria brevicollis]|uniref:Uncharacterized protein n=1 Tax=Sordaria brevicollis TaxID=83679 RepID=A0AAE0U2D0_SORBR|nr:hypothetical protein B0T20DRAFT_104026 [Sordaria brevicollis]
MAHHRTPSYYDSHDDYASSSSSHRHSTYPPASRHSRPAYTTVRPFVINSRDSPPYRSHKTPSHDLNREVGDYVADRLVPTILRSSDRPVEVFMNFGDAKFSLPDHDHQRVRGGINATANAIVYNAPGCSLMIDGRRCKRYCEHCDGFNRDHRSQDRDQYRGRHRELDFNPNSIHHTRHPRSHSHVRITSYSRNPSPSLLPLEGLFPIATALENAQLRNDRQRVSNTRCLGCLMKTKVYRDGYCVDCDPTSYRSRERRVEPRPVHMVTDQGGRRARVRYIGDDMVGGSGSDHTCVRVERGLSSRGDRDRQEGRGRSGERVRVYDVLTDDRGHGG